MVFSLASGRGPGSARGPYPAGVPQPIVISAASIRVTIAPWLGGAITDLSLDTPSGPVPLLRRAAAWAQRPDEAGGWCLGPGGEPMGGEAVPIDRSPLHARLRLGGGVGLGVLRIEATPGGVEIDLPERAVGWAMAAPMWWGESGVSAEIGAGVIRLEWPGGPARVIGTLAAGMGWSWGPSGDGLHGVAVGMAGAGDGAGDGAGAGEIGVAGTIRLGVIGPGVVGPGVVGPGG